MFFLCHTELCVPLHCYISAVMSSGNAALLSAVSSFLISLSLLNKSFSLIHFYYSGLKRVKTYFLSSVDTVCKQ